MSLGQVLFSFDGRINRREFWLKGILPLWVASLLVGAVSGLLDDLGIILVVVWVIPAIIASLAVLIKRWHDLGRSGLWVLPGFIPILGALYSLVTLLILGICRGQAVDNQYGPPPGNR